MARTTCRNPITTRLEAIEHNRSFKSRSNPSGSFSLEYSSTLSLSRVSDDLKEIDYADETYMCTTFFAKSNRTDLHMYSFRHPFGTRGRVCILYGLTLCLVHCLSSFQHQMAAYRLTSRTLVVIHAIKPFFTYL